MVVETIDLAVAETITAFRENPKSRWIIGFSGGKDSTALLKVIYAAYLSCETKPTKIDVIYCDTGVENPILDRYVKNLFSSLNREFQRERVSFETHLLKAPVSDRFFVKVIGRGYPTPTNKFRWCTNKLRIGPVSNFIGSAAEADAIVCLGLRRNESIQRDRSLSNNGNHIWQEQTEAGNKYRLFLPILDFSVEDVWEAICEMSSPASINANELAELYKGASGECPIVRPLEPTPCGSGRFGCWTCTVVRQDKSSLGLIRAGFSELIPFYDFRSWLLQIRNDPDRRWPQRRNGATGPGPLTLSARKEIYSKLQKLERETGTTLLEAEEVQEIERLWKLDEGSEPIRC
ncbi:phosphoadenosine phosphosulfate reductase family protein [Thalassospira sp. MCCC 1A02803]|uniref:phosphoadenosine phosphosulfate reductase domain-containing protein n=1 Tax=Thalassospira sp. MCCC 1A02803 TaxID=501863 RepID=UPI000AC493A5|nr:phosphoadenosine phosphosulfate reductase family protein [Thalassospira sp. MCCC 1A02803]